jgi:hypothetical protein
MAAEVGRKSSALARFGYARSQKKRPFPVKRKGQTSLPSPGRRHSLIAPSFSRGRGCIWNAAPKGRPWTVAYRVAQALSLQRRAYPLDAVSRPPSAHAK